MDLAIGWSACSWGMCSNSVVLWHALVTHFTCLPSYPRYHFKNSSRMPLRRPWRQISLFVTSTSANAATVWCNKSGLLTNSAAALLSGNFIATDISESKFLDDSQRLQQLLCCFLVDETISFQATVPLMCCKLS